MARTLLLRLSPTIVLVMATISGCLVGSGTSEPTTDAHDRTGFELPASVTPVPTIEFPPGVIMRITYEDYERRSIEEHTSTEYGVTTTDEAARLGERSGVADLRPGDEGWRGSSPRSEWQASDVVALDVERWHGISYYLPIDWNDQSLPDGSGGNRIVYQFHTAGGSFGPIFGIRLTDTPTGAEWRFYRKQANNQSEILWAELTTPETWIDIVMHVKWTEDLTGFIEFYRDRELVYSSHGVRTMHPAGLGEAAGPTDTGPYSKWGVYQGTARILVDEVRIAEGPNMLAAVSP